MNTISPSRIAGFVQRFYETNTGCKVVLIPSDNHTPIYTITVYFLFSEFTKIKNMAGLEFDFFSKSFDYSLDKEVLEMTTTLNDPTVFVEFWEKYYETVGAQQFASVSNN